MQRRTPLPSVAPTLTRAIAGISEPGIAMTELARRVRDARVVACGAMGP